MNTLSDLLWDIFRNRFAQQGPAHHQIQAYNEFVQELLPNIIREKGRVEIDREDDAAEEEENDEDEKKPSKKKSWVQVVEFSNPEFGRVCYREIDDTVQDLFPSEARKRGIPYNAAFYCDVTVTTSDGESKVYPKEVIAEIPVMVRSCLCNLTRYNIVGDACYGKLEDPMDRGGYFILNREIVVICSERGAFGRVYTYSDKQMLRGMPKYDVHSEIRVSATSNTRTTTAYVGLENGVAVFFGQHISSSGIPLCVLLEAMGVSYLDILKYVPKLTSAQRKHLLPSLEQARAMFPKSRKKREATIQKALGIIENGQTTQSLLNTIFPNYKEMEEKVWFLCYMLSRAIKVKTGEREPEDRDHYANKRVDCVDSLLNNLFYSMWNQMTKAIRDSCGGKGRNSNPLKIVQSKSFTKKLGNALATGNWNSYNTGKKKPGISQFYERFNGIGSASNMRKLHAAIGTEGNMTKPRRVHESSYGFVCPPDTPESKERTGLSKVIALSATVSLGCTTEECMQILGAIPEFSRDFGKGTFVFLNGMIAGSTETPEELIAVLTDMKRSNNFFWDCCFVYDKKFDEVRVNCDSGRLIRPLMVVKDGKLVFKREHHEKMMNGEMTWQDFLGAGILEFVDAEQQEHSFICPSAEELGEGKKWTHCEMHPLLFYGVCSSIINYSSNNPSPRLSYFASMAKSSIAVPRLDYKEALYDQHVLHYPQAPLASTKAGRLLGMNDSPISQNIVVGVCAFEGWSQEDAIIPCKSFKERGGFASTHSQTYTGEVGHGQKQVEKKDMGELECSESCKRLWCTSCKKKVILCPECNTEYIPSNGGFKGRMCRKGEDKRREIVNDGIRKWNENLKKGQKPFDLLKPREWGCLCLEVEERPRLDHLDEYGVVDVGQVVEDGDILVAIADESGDKLRDESVYFSKDEKGIVTNVCLTQNIKGSTCFRVTVESVRTPKVGDKATSCHSQKGTFSRFVSEEDMPFSPDPFSATHPDFLINPLAFPSRMTIGQLREGNAGKKTACAHRDLPDETRFEYEALYEALSERLGRIPCPSEISAEIIRKKGNPETLDYSGSYTDCSPFTSVYELVEDELKKRGYSPGGKEFYIDGMTGKKIEVNLFVSLVQYNRLKHMVDDKIHARATGKIQSLTRQPTEGRSRNGGLKVGTMEVSCLVGNGAIFCLRDRMFSSCDKYDIWVCTSCGNIAINAEGKKICRACHGKSNVAKLSTRYSTKLAYQELMAMGITPRILLE
ncbi:DNA-directed RNA polymerase subunit 2 [Brazilian marseillevirus]|uniref:DNA-directed RNA polymerase subunit 2 n=1 Tax=Brazilian marseillevirus TaxID=1813599 RepID=UPI00078183F5|nr:DNA-directed RNA polymerase subunit 2 [Brazilian marseillevirus]AMQ10553.1 DNA-directed RNA polymerase subunit 2 [Brazilian marseillevirus]